VNVWASPDGMGREGDTDLVLASQVAIDATWPQIGHPGALHQRSSVGAAAAETSVRPHATNSAHGGHNCGLCLSEVLLILAYDLRTHNNPLIVLGCPYDVVHNRSRRESQATTLR